MAAVKFINKSRSSVKFIDSRGARKNYNLIIESKPKCDPRQYEPAKTLKNRKAFKTNTFKVIGGNAKLQYDLIFEYTIDKYEFGLDGPMWVPRPGTFGAVKYKGPMTHYMECEIKFTKMSVIGKGGSSNPRLHFQLNQWYGPIVPMPKTDGRAITNGYLDMVAANLVIQKTNW